MRKLYLDIETSPNVVYAWDLYNTNIGISQVIEPTRMICVAYQFDDGPMKFAAEWKQGTQEMVKAIYSAVDEADAVVHYNGRSFDETHLNREFLQAGFTPPAPYQTIDLITTVRKRFRFAANRLQQVVTELDLGEKLKTDFDLWKNVLNGDEKSQRLMERYNKKDVALLSVLYDKLQPWLIQHPNVGLYLDEDGLKRCTKCGSKNIILNGKHYTSAGVFQQYLCKDCGGWSRSSHRLSTTGLRGA